VDKPDPRLQSFVKKYKERGKTALPPKLAGGPPDCNQITIYDGIMVNKLGMEKYKITNQPGDLGKDREKIREGWTNLKDYPGIAGLTTMSPDGDAVGDTYVIMVKGGRFVAVK
jgi:ABC-type branched-subunit amino acid transport system substrate-binding protein